MGLSGRGVFGSDCDRCMLHVYAADIIFMTAPNDSFAVPAQAKSNGDGWVKMRED